MILAEPIVFLQGYTSKQAYFQHLLKLHPKAEEVKAGAVWVEKRDIKKGPAAGWVVRGFLVGGGRGAGG